MSRLKDVAEAAGVSIRTVGRALTGQGYVDAGVRDRVLSAARRLDYRPDRLARSLRTGRSHEVLVLAGGWGGQHDELHIAKIAGMERALRAADLSLGLFYGLEAEARRLGRDVLEELIARRPAGVAMAPSRQMPAKPTARRLAGADLPYVLLDSAEDGVDTARHDRSRGVYEAILWLAGRGRQRIAYIGPRDDRTRLDGYEQAMRELRRQPIIIDEPDADWDGGRAAAAKALALDPRPDALQVYGDIGAMGVLAGLHDRGIRVPQEMAVVGFDDRAAAALAWPPLTTVRQDNLALGEAAAGILIAKSRGDEPPAGGWVRVIPTRLVVRATT